MIITNKRKHLKRLQCDTVDSQIIVENAGKDNHTEAVSGQTTSGDFHDAIVYNNPTKVYRFFINGVIYDDEKWFEPLMKTLSGTTDNPNTTSIEIYLNSPGGSLYTATQLIAAINRCKLPVHLFVEGRCMSAATIISCGGEFDTISIDDYTDVLFHTARMFSWGKLPDIRNDITNTERIFDMLCNDYYRDILTKAEIEKIKQGHELYMTGREFKERFIARAEKEEKALKRKKK